MSENSNDSVGYGQPPKKHQFKKGKSGNPNGRPRKSKNIDTLINRELDKLITMKEGGQEIRISKREAIVKRLVNKALQGEPRHIEYLVKYCKEHGANDPFIITAEDAAALERALERKARQKLDNQSRDVEEVADDKDEGDDGWTGKTKS